MLPAGRPEGRPVVRRAFDADHVRLMPRFAPFIN
jgi:hypothetical protein